MLYRKRMRTKSGKKFTMEIECHGGSSPGCEAVLERLHYKKVNEFQGSIKKAQDPKRGNTKRKVQAFVERLKQKGYSQEKIVRILLKNKVKANKKGNKKLLKNLRSYLRRLDYKRYMQ